MAEVQIFNLGSQYWTELLEKGIGQGLLNGKDQDLLSCAIKYCNGLMTISPAQANYIWNVKEQLEQSGVK